MSTRASRRLVGRGTVRETQPRWARGSRWRRAPAVARLEAACGARQLGLHDAVNDEQRGQLGSRKPAAQGRRLAAVRASLRRRAAGRRRSERRSRPSVAPSDSNPFKSRHRRAGLPDARSTKVVFFCHCRGRQRPEAVAADAPPCTLAEKLEVEPLEASRGLSTPLDTATFCLCDTPNNHLPGLGTPTESVPHLPVNVRLCGTEFPRIYCIFSLCLA